MKAEFWEERWRTGRIGFHQHEYEPSLVRLFPTLGIEVGTQVLVPLCGKSLDMLWLREAGYRVLGVELIEQAVLDFFAENDIPFERAQDGPFVRYEAGAIELLCGDVFDLDRARLAPVGAVYDRAALIALPQAMRRRYADHLLATLPEHFRMLLMTIDYDQSKRQGPPFAVGAREVRELYESRARVERLASSDIIGDAPRFRERAVDELLEEFWRVER